MKWSKRVYKRWMERTKSIVNDTAHSVAKRIAETADKYDSTIVPENLKRLRTKGVGEKR